MLFCARVGALRFDTALKIDGVLVLRIASERFRQVVGSALVISELPDVVFSEAVVCAFRAELRRMLYRASPGVFFLLGGHRRSTLAAVRQKNVCDGVIVPKLD